MRCGPPSRPASSSGSLHRSLSTCPLLSPRDAFSRWPLSRPRRRPRRRTPCCGASSSFSSSSCPCARPFPPFSASPCRRGRFPRCPPWTPPIRPRGSPPIRPPDLGPASPTTARPHRRRGTSCANRSACSHPARCASDRAGASSCWRRTPRRPPPRSSSSRRARRRSPGPRRPPNPTCCRCPRRNFGTSDPSWTSSSCASSPSWSERGPRQRNYSHSRSGPQKSWRARSSRAPRPPPA
mmetsp:Transcript_13887/g.34291  ORF Transcript_13887/g.34291 Transcript_13887/m.34291 type:complete len:238 (-) Transcript_13887:1556-2269(-)